MADSEDIIKAVLVIVGAMLFIGFVVLLMAWPTEFLVNYLFTPSLLISIFGVAKITWTQALCINTLASILFKSSSSSKSSS